MNIKKIVFASIGIISLGFGFLGAVLPLLPAFPFLLLSAVCFGKSSKRLNDWFVSSRIYQENLQPFLEGKGMRKEAKIRVMITITVLMSIGFVMMHRIVLGQIVLFVIWAGHILYFVKGVKTIEE